MIFIVICNDVWRCLWCSIYHGDFTDKSSDDWDDDWAIPNVYIYTWSFLVGKLKHEALINETM
jgi:hypothetical protein